MTNKERIADLEKEKQKLLESVEGTTAMYIDLQNAMKRIAELEAGRPKWHKVADGDLPKIGKPCLVYLANDSVITARLREDNVWTTNGCNAFENVIAWCEIPDFEEEVKECRT